jgi:RNA polymerase sigma factor (sigma-70 family)
MKDLELTVRLRNNRLKERRDALGMSLKTFALAANVPKTPYQELELLRRSPIAEVDGSWQWQKIALKLAAFYEVDPEELFPPTILDIKTPLVIRKLDANDILPLPPQNQQKLIDSPDVALEHRERNERVESVLASLKPQQAQVLRLRFGLNKDGEHLYSEIASALNIPRERVRLIEEAAFRQLYHLHRYNKLLPFKLNT